MMKWMSRILCAILATVMVLSFVGCGGETDKPDEETTGGAQGTQQGGSNDVEDATDAETADPATVFNLPDDLDFDGKEFVMLLRSNQARVGAQDEFEVVLGEKSDVVDKAVYARQETIQTDLNMKFRYIFLDTEAELLETYRNTAGMGEFHVAGTHAAQMSALMAEGLGYNWLEVPHVDTSKVWWYSRSGMAESLTINGRLYMITGDASTLAQGKAMAMFVNKPMLEVHGNMEIEDLYDVVSAGDWTIDYLLELTKNMSDPGGDGVYDENDIYGVNFYLATICDNYFAAFNIPIVNCENEYYSISLYNNTMINAVEKLHAMCYEDNRTYLTTDKTTSAAFFKNGHAVFTHGGFEWADQKFSDMASDYGIIPYPKLSEDQERYGAALSDVYTAFILPYNATELEFVGAVMEKLGYTAYTITTPAYYDTLLKGRSTRDAKSREMLDLIHDSISFDMGFVYSAALGHPVHAFRKMLATPEAGNLSSYWNGNGAKFNEKLQDLLATFGQEN